jgi:hypothetical protein
VLCAARVDDRVPGDKCSKFIQIQQVVPPLFWDHRELFRKIYSADLWGWTVVGTDADAVNTPTRTNGLLVQRQHATALS